MEPGEVLVKLEEPTGDARLDALRLTLKLAEASRRAATGDPFAIALVEDLKRQGASHSWKSNSFSPAKPIGKRLTPARRRNAERINPARIFAALEARGMVERMPGVGTASRIRIKMPSKPDNSDT